MSKKAPVRALSIFALDYFPIGLTEMTCCYLLACHNLFIIIAYWKWRIRALLQLHIRTLLTILVFFLLPCDAETWLFAVAPGMILIPMTSPSNRLSIWRADLSSLFLKSSFNWTILQGRGALGRPFHAEFFRWNCIENLMFYL